MERWIQRKQNLVPKIADKGKCGIVVVVVYLTENWHKTRVIALATR